MKNLPNHLVNKAAVYSKLEDEDKLKLLNDLYWNRNLSWKEIADLCETYPNKVRRDATKLGMESRSKSEAQSLALKEGRHPHPTMGKGHSESAKIAISEKISEKWENISEDEKARRSAEAKKRWEEKPEEEIERFRKASYDAIRTAAKEGSSLEKYLLEGLIKNGYKVDFHKEHWVERERLQIDLMIPSLGIAIEVDGPSHFKAIWGSTEKERRDTLQKNIQRDREKNGLLLRQGFVIIRIRQEKGSLSEKFKRDTLKQLLGKIKEISKNKPKEGERCIILGETK